jgi:hypothetical protein
MAEVDLSDLEEMIAEDVAYEIIQELEDKLKNPKFKLGEFRLYFERNIDIKKDPYNIPWENAKEYEYWAGSIILKYNIKKGWLSSLGTEIPIIHIFNPVSITPVLYVNVKELGDIKIILKPVEESFKHANEIFFEKTEIKLEWKIDYS